MRIEILLSPTGSSATIKAIDLTSDTWDDFRYYLAEAGQANATADVPKTNRALRSALVNLFAHLEGVVGELHSRLTREHIDFKPEKPRRGYSTLKGQINDLCNHATQRMGIRITPPRMRYKLLRDIVVHPNITKPAQGPEAETEVEYTEVDLFDLTVEGLQSEGEHLSEWLDQLCSTYGDQRLQNTYHLCKEFADSLGDGLAEPRKV